MSVRVRYAPSPTGSPHVGNIRTALFDHLFAKREGGTMILRLEDTDRNRYVPGTEQEIAESLRYLGIEWQEGPDVGGPCGPYRQSERRDAGLYQPHIDHLLESGAAYWAFDTPEELAAMRAEQESAKAAVGYFGEAWRDASPSQVEAARRDGKAGVVRLRVPRGGTVRFRDHLRGALEVASDTLDDVVLIKADGMPTYHFAAMVDDHLMGITHVFRGVEWLASAPKHQLLYDALGWTPPEWVHVPVVNGKDGKKLSKRHGDTACLDFRRSGYPGEALANFVALIGWAPGDDREILPGDALWEAFSLDGLQPSPGVFDLDKLNWMSGQYLRATPVPELAERVRAYAAGDEAQAYWSQHDPTKAGLLKALANSPELAPVVELARERVTTLADFATAGDFLLGEPVMDEAAWSKWSGQAHVPTLLAALADWAADQARLDPSGCEGFLRAQAVALGFEERKIGPVVHPVRLALTGRTAGPGLFELMAALGPTRVADRARRVLAEP